MSLCDYEKEKILQEQKLILSSQIKGLSDAINSGEESPNSIVALEIELSVLSAKLKGVQAHIEIIDEKNKQKSELESH